ncbi:Uncharacterised protein [Vibrio cholerae]|nr:Uncharacterised protein [Vibrio cholerae]
MSIHFVRKGHNFISSKQWIITYGKEGCRPVTERDNKFI